MAKPSRSMKKTAMIRQVFGRKMLVALSMGFSCGVPLLLTISVLQAWMKQEGVDLGVIGPDDADGFTDLGSDLDGRGDRRPQQSQGLLQDLVDSQRFPGLHRLAAVAQKLTHDIPGPQAGGPDLLEIDPIGALQHADALGGDVAGQ